MIGATRHLSSGGVKSLDQLIPSFSNENASESPEEDSLEDVSNYGTSSVTFCCTFALKR
jgi:hypothetical protein